MPLLALDVGNTNVTAGLFEAERLCSRWRTVTHAHASAKVIAATVFKPLPRGQRIDVICSSVVPSIDRALGQACRAYFGVPPLSVTSSSPLGLTYKVDKPKQVGADRVVNALAAWTQLARACVIIDFGTATTFDCVSNRGEYLGGAILPGPDISAQALAERTAKLPSVRVRKPRRVIGRNTVECIEAGLYYGYLGMIEKVLALTLREMGGRPRVIATGGLANLFRADLPKGIAFNPDLTLTGLRIAHGILRPQKEKLVK